RPFEPRLSALGLAPSPGRYVPGGCERREGTGYSGWVLGCEALPFTPSLQELLLTWKPGSLALVDLLHPPPQLIRVRGQVVRPVPHAPIPAHRDHVLVVQEDHAGGARGVPSQHPALLGVEVEQPHRPIEARRDHPAPIRREREVG